MTSPPSASDPSAVERPIDEPTLLTSNLYSLSRAVYARRAEYVLPHRIRVKIGTWNVAAGPGTDKDLRSWFDEDKSLDKGLDQRLAEPNLPHNPAVENGGVTPGAENHDPGPRLVGGDKIGLYVLGLQEVIDLSLAKVSVFTDTGPMEKWKAALAEALPEGYELVVAEQLSGILLLIYAATEVAASISNISSVMVGTGFMGYMGNKGGVATRIVLGEATRMVFVNSHLASGSEPSNLERRCWDYGQILQRTQFEPINHTGVLEDEGEVIGDEDFAFWFGDLNFRLEGLPGDDIRRLLTLHTQGEYDISKTAHATLDVEDVFINVDDEGEEDGEEKEGETDTSTTASTSRTDLATDDMSDSLQDSEEFEPDAHQDPASLQATLDSLLPHDQLRKMIKERKAFFEGWREGPITFLPTYKYDVGTVGLFDSSEKQRAPSWCDRILFRTRQEVEEYKKKIKEEEEAREKDEDMIAQGLDRAGDDDELLFDYDPESDGGNREISLFDYDENADAYSDTGQEIVTKEGFVDHIHQEIYTSHQRISSSDHKPVISVFTLDYDAVVPELKARVHAEVVRDLDRAENEGRPNVTIIIDGQSPISGDGVDLGDIGYLQKKTQTLTLANTGRVPATFSFAEKPAIDASEGEPSGWLSTNFSPPDVGEEAIDLGKEVTLEPGDTVIGIIEVQIDSVAQLRALNSGTLKLEDVLILRVTDGKDHFIPVRANWLPTSFGRSVDELIRIPACGIRDFAKTHPQIASSGVPYDLDVHSSHPRELFRLIEVIEALAERVAADATMIEGSGIPTDKPGWPFNPASWKYADSSSHYPQRAAIIEALDSDASVLGVFQPETPAAQRLELAAEVLLLFLDSLVDGIITAPLWGRIEAAIPSLASSARSPEEIEDDKTVVLDILSTAPNHNISFVFLAAMLAKVANELAPVDKSTASAFAARKKSDSLSRRSLSFRRGTAAQPEVVTKRLAVEYEFARQLGKVVCRAGGLGAADKGANAKEKRATEGKMAALVEAFLRRE